jgi:excisionase family DNA binding protein
MDNIAVLTVPAKEWNETRELLHGMSEMLSTLTNKPNKELLSPKEVCSMLKIGRSTFERLKNSGQMKVIRTQGARKIYVERIEVEKLLLSDLQE